MVEHDDSRVGPRTALALLSDRRLSAKCIADKHRMGEARISHAQVGDRGAESSIAHRYSDHQPECEDAVHDALAELGALGKFRIEMERLWIVRQRAKDQVVCFRDGARDRMLEYLADFEFVKV